MLRDRPSLLLVDDDEADAFLLRKAFRNAGLDIDFAHVVGGAEFLAQVVGFDPPTPAGLVPDVVLMDVNMPAMNGFETLRRLRSSERAPAVPVVIFTTSSLPDDIEMSYQLGANSFIVKPSTLKELTDFARGFHDYWFHLTRLPSAEI